MLRIDLHREGLHDVDGTLRGDELVEIAPLHVAEDRSPRDRVLGVGLGLPLEQHRRGDLHIGQMARLQGAEALNPARLQQRGLIHQEATRSIE